MCLAFKQNSAFLPFGNDKYIPPQYVDLEMFSSIFLSSPGCQIFQVVW